MIKVNALKKQLRDIKRYSTATYILAYCGPTTQDDGTVLLRIETCKTNDGKGKDEIIVYTFANADVCDEYMQKHELKYEVMKTLSEGVPFHFSRDYLYPFDIFMEVDGTGDTNRGMFDEELPVRYVTIDRKEHVV